MAGVGARRSHSQTISPQRVNHRRRSRRSFHQPATHDQRTGHGRYDSSAAAAPGGGGCYVRRCTESRLRRRRRSCRSILYTVVAMMLMRMSEGAGVVGSFTGAHIKTGSVSRSYCKLRVLGGNDATERLRRAVEIRAEDPIISSVFDEVIMRNVCVCV